MKNNHFLYNLKGIARECYPRFLLPKNRERILREVHKRSDVEYIKKRVDYYCRLDSKLSLESSALPLSYLRFTRKNTVYFFDTYEYAMYFPQDFRAHYAFGDVYYLLDKPSITKSRPICQNSVKTIESSPDSSSISAPPLCENTDVRFSVLLNLDKIRHFIFINDPYPFEAKLDILFFRGGVYQPHRDAFFKKHFNNPRCNLGHTGSKSIHKAWQKPKIGIKAHLPYKFLLSLEGNDVASNLKWILSSNSLCLMPKPKFETWFMEGRLESGVHYVEIKPDYSDVDEKLDYYITHINEAKDIIKNAQHYTQQFLDKQREDIISLLVLEKYFYYTNQLDAMRL